VRSVTGGLLAAIVIAFGSLIVASAAAAATWTVTTTADTMPATGSCTPDSCSLRQAIEASGAGDTIIVPASASPYSVSNGRLGVQHALTITGGGAGSTVIEATPQNHNRVMVVFGNAAAVRLQNLTITGGDTTTTGGSGGGIAAAGPGPLVLNNVDVVGNTVDTTNAGAAFNQGGGGIYSTVSVILNGCKVSDNTVTVPLSDGDGGGGGILMAQTNDNSDNLTLTNSTVSDNTATVAPDNDLLDNRLADANGGGGIYMDGGNLTIVNSMIAGNIAAVSSDPTITATPTDGGGGIFQFGNQFLLQNSTVSGNVAHGPGIDRGGGGGILDTGNGSQYLNSTITGNSTDEPAATGQDTDSDGGGGVLLNNVKDGVTFANMTINANSASAATGGGVNNEIDTTADVTDSILVGNTASDANGNCAGGLSSDGYNLTDDLADNNTCTLTATGDILGESPDLANLADNGGPTPTEALLGGSPAIDAGNPAGCTDLMGNPLTTDQRGVIRPEPPGTRCDIGAYEVALPVVAIGASVVSGSSVSFQATVANPDPRPGTVIFEYGPTQTYGSSTPAQAVPGFSTAQNFTAAVSGLPVGTYHVRAVATNPDGTDLTTDGVFTITAPVPPAPPGARPIMITAPTVKTTAPTGVGPFAVTLKGIVSAGGQTTRYHFEYGTSSSGTFSSSAPTRSLDAARVNALVSASLSGLRPGRDYRYRLVAVNAAGTTMGTVIRFSTAPKPAPAAFSAKITPTTQLDAYVARGRLTLPAGLALKNGCAGTVTVQAIARHRTIGQSRTSIGHACAFRVEIKLSGARGAVDGRVRFQASFAGNGYLAPRPAGLLVVRG
jgi:hypothetical protein